MRIRQKRYFSPSKLKNAIFQNYVLDYLKFIEEEKSNGSKTITNYLCDQGNNFEKKVFTALYEKFGENNILNLSYLTDYNSKKRDYEKAYIITKNVLNTREKPVILQSYVKNDVNKTCGIPDIIIRGDYLNMLIDDELLIIPSHYYVVDVKFCTLYLKSDGQYLLKNNKSTFYQCQTQIYTEAIHSMTYGRNNARFSFILGRAYTFTKNGEKMMFPNCFSKLAYVPSNNLTIKKLINKSVDFYDRLEKYGDNWSLDKFDQVNYKNIVQSYNKKYKEQIFELCRNSGDITIIYQCGRKHKDIMMRNKIFSFYDERCTSKLLGFKNKTEKQIQNILSVNQKKSLLYLPRTITKSPENSWWVDVNRYEVFLDIELLNNIFESFQSFPNRNSEDYVFFIGYIIFDRETNTKVYHKEIMNSLSSIEEEKCFRNFIDVLRDLPSFTIYHYGNFEKYHLEKLFNKYEVPTMNLNLVDLLKVVKNENVAIKNCFSFKLKDISLALINNGLLNNSELKSWGAQHMKNISSGVEAMFKSYQLYESNNIITKEIINYNHDDCLTLFYILNFLRSLVVLENTI